MNKQQIIAALRQQQREATLLASKCDEHKEPEVIRAYVREAIALGAKIFALQEGIRT